MRELRFHRSDGVTFDELGFGERLAEIFFSAAHVVDPLHDSANNGAMIPSDVGDRGMAPDEGGILIGADERNIVGNTEAFFREIVVGRVEEKWLVDNERGGWCGTEE